MHAIWSFWSKPHRLNPGNRWLGEKYHLYSWVLSCETARKHFSTSVLHTDDYGARLLSDLLMLPFSEVKTDLNTLDNYDPEWWTLGKLYSYRAQTQPFVHLDNDVFLWKSLPERIYQASVFAQNVEHFVHGDSWYQVDLWETAISSVRGWLPKEWTWYSKRRQSEAACCGVFGGTRTDFISYYADNAIRVVNNRRNQPAWRLLSNRIQHNILFEQYYLAACIAYHSRVRYSSYKNLRVEYLFPSEEAAFNETCASHMGYTHLIAGSKSDPHVAARLEHRILAEYPEYYDRIQRICGYPG